MDRTKNLLRIAVCSLGFLAHLTSLTAQAVTHDLGLITQSEGEITFFNFNFHNEVAQIKKGDKLTTNGSYLTKENSFFVVKLFDGSYLRLNPRSKMALEYEPDFKTLRILLFTGSIKALITQTNKINPMDKIIVQSAGASFEASESKFTVSRNIIDDISSVYVEKGAVVATQSILGEKKDMELVHQEETTSIRDKDLDVKSSRKMKDKEIKYLHPSRYLEKKIH
jgi:hypothetical protein